MSGRSHVDRRGLPARPHRATTTVFPTTVRPGSFTVSDDPTVRSQARKVAILRSRVVGRAFVMNGTVPGRSHQSSDAAWVVVFDVSG